MEHLFSHGLRRDSFPSKGKLTPVARCGMVGGRSGIAPWRRTLRTLKLLIARSAPKAATAAKIRYAPQCVKSTLWGVAFLLKWFFGLGLVLKIAEYCIISTKWR